MSDRASGGVRVEDTDERRDSYVWKRCVCDQFGRCLTDCPSADLDRPDPSSYWDRRRREWVQR